MLKNSPLSLISLSDTVLRNSLSDLESFPLGALRQAQHVLHLAEAESGSDSEKDSSVDSEVEPEVHDIKGKRKERVEWSAKPRTDISKRSNKHAWVLFVDLDYIV